MKIPNGNVRVTHTSLSLARIVSEDSQPIIGIADQAIKSSKDS